MKWIIQYSEYTVIQKVKQEKNKREKTNISTIYQQEEYMWN